jgi:hypothetical protein
MDRPEKWWRNRESNPARQSCKDRLQLTAFPVVPSRGSSPRSPRLQLGAFNRLAYWANWRGYRESNPGWRCGTPPDCRNLSSAWWVTRELNTACPKAQLLQSRSVTRLGVTRDWLRVRDLPTLRRLMRPQTYLFVLPAIGAPLELVRLSSVHPRSIERPADPPCLQKLV